MTIGVLVMAYGTAAGPDDIERYYTDIRGGRPPSPELLQELRERYAAIGNRFPLTEITEAQAAGLERELGDGFRAYVGMKHSPPFIPETVEKMAADGIERAVGIVMAPHYSRMSIGGYVDRVRKVEAPIEVDVIESWHSHPAYLEVLADRVRRALGTLPEDPLVVFTAHSLPARIVDEGDPYPEQLRETADAIAERLGLAHHTTGWQSAGRTPEPWLGPPLEELIPEVAKEHPAVLVVPCGFVSDHLEILYDLDVEAREIAEREGIAFARTESLNAESDFVAALASIVRDRLASWER
ncbi:MAG TPA: ferrochelatase [Actinomycetota bacterium]